MKTKIIMALMTALLAFIPTSDAAKIDAYRDALVNRSFTIKYEIVQPPVRNTDKYAEIMEGEFVDKTESALNRFSHNGLVVGDGEDFYSERVFGAHQTRFKNRVSGAVTKTDVAEHGICNLTKGGEKFYFAYDLDDGKRKYYGSYNDFGAKSSRVKAGEDRTLEVSSMQLPALQRLIEENKFGSSTLARALAPILPPDKVIATINTPNYKFIRSGSLGNGLTYEDFAADKNGTFYATRYYFSGDQMVKIACIDYTRQNGKIVDYDKSVVEIIEFTNTPDKSYLSLPAGLKDKTKRDKEASK